MSLSTGIGQRTLEQLRNHYEVEKSLAERLRNASRAERSAIYMTMYDELFAQVPDHPRLTRREDPVASQKRITQRFKLLEGFLGPEKTFLEFGPGDCRFAFEVCRHVRHVYAVDICNQIGHNVTRPENFEFITYDGYHVPLPNESVDIAFSDQLLEHLHPEDVSLHFQLVHAMLRPGGRYIFATPHRFTGPHDVSRYFSREAEGFHLKEWTHAELIQIFQERGFSGWEVYRLVKDIRVHLPTGPVLTGQRLIGRLPYGLRRRLGRVFLGHIVMEARK